MPAIKRVAFSMDEKVALRKQQALDTQLSQQGFCKWFEESCSKPIRQATVREILSSRYSHINQQMTPAQASVKKQRPKAYPDLEHALSHWLFAYENSLSLTISGEVVKAKARFFWRLLPQYHGQQEPSFSDVSYRVSSLVRCSLIIAMLTVSAGLRNMRKW
jgi:hypothetical protein